MDPQVAVQGGDWVSAVTPLLKLLCLTVIGLLLAHPRAQVVPKATFKLLSKLVFALFLPCLIFVHLGQSVTLHNVLHWWFIPVNVLIATAVGCALGYAVALVCRPPPRFFRFTVIMTGFGNTGNLPIAIIGSVCHTADHPFGPGCHREGIAYVSFAQWVAVLLVYTLVYHMMEPPMQYYEIVGEGHEIEEEPQLSNFSRPLLHEAEWPGMADKETEHSKTPFIARIFASISGSSQNTFPDIDFTEEGGISGAGPSSPKSLRCLAEPKVVRRMRVVAEKTPIQHVLQPPTIASLLAIIIGIVMLADRLHLLVENDHMYRFVLSLQYSTPSAILLGAIASLRGYSVKEASALLFWQHICAVFSLSIYLVVYFKLLSYI
ncbi:unnamed protein product [Triticum turgidum subsp. durum]|uniref:Auxin efflux carrier component n=1 Tax=Triticum turgidum subsp. durum TaxID=4567 RepID=A0A9R1QZ40_TRITD|nr:unnamed protein product [Triticum turgidum subsp. durum]